MGLAEKALVKSHFGGQRIGHADPGDDAFDLDRVAAGSATFGVRNQLGLHFGDLTGGVFDCARALDDVAVFKAHLVAGEEPEETFGWYFFVVAALDPDLAADLEAALAQLRLVRVHGRAAVVERA